MHARTACLAGALVLAVALALPATTLAADPAPVTPTAPVVGWRAHLVHMQLRDGNLGSHVDDRIAMHGPMAGLCGPTGSVVGMMAAPAAETRR